MKAPNVSIIMATYNRSHLILESLYSLINQTFENWECLVIDDGSSDDTEKKVNNFIHNDCRFKYLKRPENYKKGLPGCRNYGLDLALGKYVIFFDDDDISHPYNLELTKRELDKSNKSYCRYLRTTFTGKFKEDWDRSKKYEISQLDINNLEDIVTGKIPFNSCQIMWLRDCFEGERFDESLMYAEEWELYQRILSKGIKGITINKVLYFGRKHPKSNTGEFWGGNQIRQVSNTKAIKLVIKNLQSKDLLSESFMRYFIQMSFFYKNKSIFHYLLEISRPSYFVKLKYELFFSFYPILVLGHRAKKKYLNINH